MLNVNMIVTIITMTNEKIIHTDFLYLPCKFFMSALQISPVSFFTDIYKYSISEMWKGVSVPFHFPEEKKVIL